MKWLQRWDSAGEEYGSSEPFNPPSHTGGQEHSPPLLCKSDSKTSVFEQLGDQSSDLEDSGICKAGGERDFGQLERLNSPRSLRQFLSTQAWTLGRAVTVVRLAAMAAVGAVALAGRAALTSFGSLSHRSR